VVEINFEDAKIKYKGEWLSVEDLAGKIKQKMDAGDMKITNLAAALEKLKTTLENAHELEIKIVLPREDYEKLIALGGGDDRASVRKAIMAFIEGGSQTEPGPTAAPESKENIKSIIQCAKCKTPLEIPSDERPIEIECPYCGTSRILKSGDEGEPVHKDHFLG
jgi:DNA-directed RNA polymerase subunit RPC12/RpoP